MMSNINPTSRNESEKPTTYTAAPSVLRLTSASATLAVMSAHDRDWNAWLERVPHDLYHTAEYHHVQQESESGTAQLAVYGTRDRFVAWPYLLHDIADAASITDRCCRDVTSVYGYSGPLTKGCANDPDFAAKAWLALLDLWRSQEVVSIFTRFHPLLSNHQWLCGAHPICQGVSADSGVQEIGQTVAIDLTETADAIWQQYKRQARQATRRCEQLGFITTFDPDWAYCEDFMRLYHNTMDRNSAASFYYFGVDYFSNLKQRTSPHSILVLTTCDGVAGAAAVLFEYNGIANLHLLGSDVRSTQVSPAKLLVHNAQQWLRERGNRYFHLGGGRASRVEDTVFQFKSLFSRKYHPFYVGRWIIDRSAYDALSRARLQQAASCQDARLDGAFFPAYRARLFRSPR